MNTLIKHTSRLIVLSLGIAVAFDQLFWKKNPGLSFLVFVILCLLGGILLSVWEKRRPANTSLLLLAPILFFASVLAFRREPFTAALSLLLTLGAMMLLALTWQGGQWWRYSLSDTFVGFFRLAGSALARPIASLGARSVPLEPEAEGQPVSTPTPAAPTKARRGWAVLRGLLLALPVIALLASLLAAADPIFSKALSGLLDWFRIENLGEYVFRIIYICIGAYLLSGVYLHMLGPSREEKLIGLEKPWLTPFLGWIEAVIVLGAVDVLFLFFVGFQFRYFFGGQANIHLDGFTFSEYARRGFGELLAVAVISLLLFLGLSAITRRTQGTQRRVFTGLGIGLLALVATMLSNW